MQTSIFVVVTSTLLILLVLMQNTISSKQMRLIRSKDLNLPPLNTVMSAQFSQIQELQQFIKSTEIFVQR